MDNNSKHKLRKTLVKAMVAYILHMNLNLNDDTLIARDETERLLTNPGFARHSKLVSIVGPQALVIKITREMGALITSDISNTRDQIIASKEVDSMNDEGHDDRLISSSLLKLLFSHNSFELHHTRRSSRHARSRRRTRSLDIHGCDIS